ncbi:hypothetical protein RCO48_02440 [Peribacillus frigoritolerans]|nr:hypothetical protein [Peribacillus frigoritolerans]
MIPLGKKTPMKAREDVEDEVGELEKENIRYEKWFGAPYEIPIIRNDFLEQYL